jgi:hypothetical protein
VVELIFARSICSNTIPKGTLILGPESSAPGSRSINCEEARHHSPLPCGSLMWQRNDLGRSLLLWAPPHFYCWGRSHDLSRRPPFHLLHRSFGFLRLRLRLRLRHVAGSATETAARISQFRDHTLRPGAFRPGAEASGFWFVKRH